MIQDEIILTEVRFNLYRSQNFRRDGNGHRCYYYIIFFIVILNWFLIILES